MPTHLTYHSTSTLQSCSIIQLIDANGTVIEETNYDPWGRYRNPNTWQYDNTASLSMIHRGYTGHEMLPEFGLIHMNGRMYDPLLGRMLSPDNYVQDPSNPNNYNRYAYCMNNPLKYTDPSGEFWHLVIGAAIGGTSNLLMNLDNIDNFGQGLAYFGVGAAAGALGAGVGAGVGVALQGGSFGAGFIGTSTAVAGGGFWGGATTGLTNGFITGTGNSLLNGYDFGTSLENGAILGFKQGLIGGAITGTTALIKGRNFWSGDVTYKDMFEFFKNDLELTMRSQAGNDVYESTEVDYRLMRSKIAGETRPVHVVEYEVDDIMYSRSNSQKIVMNRSIVKDYYRNVGNRCTIEGWYSHEFIHAEDFHRGIPSSWLSSDFNYFNNPLEIRAYTYQFQKYGTGAWYFIDAGIAIPF